MSSVALNCTRDALVLGDASCGGIRQLLNASHLPAATLITDMSPLEAISAALQQQRAEGRAARSMHLVAHGEPGVVWVGDQAIDRAALLANAEDLANWGVKEIALWSCHVGADADFIALLEELTGAVVYSSQGWLGNQGGQSSLTLQRLARERSASIEQLTGDKFFTSTPLDFRLGRKTKSRDDNNVGDIFFGVDDENNVWQVNPSYELFPKISQPFSKVLRLFDPIEGNTRLTQNKGANGIAFDKDNSGNENDTLYFFYLTNKNNAENNGIQSNNNGGEGLKVPSKMGSDFPFNIVWWNIYKGEEAWDWVEWKDPKNAESFGPLRSGQYSPNNAAFYGDSIWYFPGNSGNLYQLKLEYKSEGENRRPEATDLIKYKIDGYPGKDDNIIFADIAINKQGDDLFLYGSHSKGRFFRIDLQRVIQSGNDSAETVKCEEGNCIEVKGAYEELTQNLALQPLDEDPDEDPARKGLQLAFNDVDNVNDKDSALWGQTYSNPQKSDPGYFGTYYIVDLKKNPPIASAPLYQAPDFDDEIKYGFRDLGGSADEPVDFLPPDFEVKGAEHCEVDWNGRSAAFQFNVTLQDIDVWDQVFGNQKANLYGPFVASFEVNSESDGEASGYAVESIRIPDPDRKDTVIEPDEDGEFKFEVDSDWVVTEPGEEIGIDDGLFSLIADVKAPDRSVLIGDEKVDLQLLLTDTGEEKPATSELSSPQECFPGAIVEIEGSAECLEVGFNEEKEAAQFSFDVSRSVTDDSQLYRYQLSSGGVTEGYEFKRADIVAFDANGTEIEDGAVVVDPDDQKSGLIEVEGGVASFDVDLQILSSDFTGIELMQLSLANVYEVGDTFEVIPITEVTGDADLNGVDCEIPVPKIGKVRRVEGNAACEIEGTPSKKDAVFAFEVSFDPAGDLEQQYNYDFAALGALSQSGYKVQSVAFTNGVTTESSADGGKSGALIVPAGVNEFEVDIVVKSADVLTGEEGLELTVSNEASRASGDAVLDEDDCGPTSGEVKSVTGEAACEGEGLLQRNQATFTFDVDLSPAGVDEIYDYLFKGSGFGSGQDYSITDVLLSPASEVSVLTPGRGRGTIDVAAGVDDFTMAVTLQSDQRLTGEEALKLTVSNDASKAAGVASLAIHDCDSPSSVLDVDGLGYCELADPNAGKDLEFSFAVTFDPGAPTLYGYELGVENISLLADYSIQPIAITDPDGAAIDVEVLRGHNTSGLVRVGEGVEKALATFHVLTDGELTGEEALTLTVGEPDAGGGVVPGTGVVGSVSAADGSGRCDPGVIDVDVTTSCSFDAGDAGVEADFSYQVTLDPDTSGRHAYRYAFTSAGFEGGNYDIRITYSSPDGDVVSKDLDRNRREGVIQAGEGVSEINIDVSVTADAVIDETEALTLTIKESNGPSSAEATAVLSTEDCIPQLPDSSLILLMDNSTSMLGSDPSTQNSSTASRLEAQNRIAFYAFEQAAERAGYGFRRKGDDAFQSFGDASTDAILNNSTSSLAKTLRQYELVDNPNDGRQAGDLIVNQITFGYVVDADESVISSDGIGTVPVQGSAIAERILLTTTPNRIYGDKIEGNATWVERNLPEPQAKDLFKGKGTEASNLYSGTEMLGALDGLQTLLERRLRRGDIDPNESTFVVMTTDGRPERRSWWDNRKGKGDGLAIPIPDSLGGDAITASGLLYDSSGAWHYVPDDNGVNQWPKTRRRLNNTLDRMADEFIDPSIQLQVEAIGLGDDEGVAYRRIYTNLFDRQTFDNSDSSWTYEFFKSFNLPDFQG